MTWSDLRPEQIEALRRYANRNGANDTGEVCDWKARLRADWLRAGSSSVNADTYALLHQLRNTHGPSWLAQLELPEEPHCVNCNAPYPGERCGHCGAKPGELSCFKCGAFPAYGDMDGTPRCIACQIPV